MSKSEKVYSISQTPNQNTPIKENNHLALSNIYPDLSELETFEIRFHALEELDKSLEELQKILPEIQKCNIQDSRSIINYQDLLIKFQNLVSNSISYLSVILNLTDCELNDDRKEFFGKEEIIQFLKNYFARTNKLIDYSLTAVVHDGPVLGINLEPDKQKFSELKATLSKVNSRLEEIHQENREVELERGGGEQNTYERIEENNYQSIPVEGFLNRPSDFENKISTSYTSHIQVQKDLIKVLNQVEQGDTVVIQRPCHADVAMIAANELSVLLEEVYLLRSPINSKRLFEAIEWSEQKLSEPLESTSLEQLRQELETELEQETAPTI